MRLPCQTLRPTEPNSHIDIPTVDMLYNNAYQSVNWRTATAMTAKKHRAAMITTLADSHKIETAEHHL